MTPAYGALECGPSIDAARATVALLSNGADVNAPQRGGDSLLHAAARRGDAGIVRYLLRRGAAVDARDARGETALEQATRLGHADVGALLRDEASVVRDDFTTRYAWDASGAPVVWPDLSDLSAADHQAVTGPSHGNFAGVRAAIGSDPRRHFARSTQDELAVEASAHTGARDIARYHLDAGLPQSLVTSLSIGDLARARALLAAHAGAIHERGPHDFAPLWYAAIGGGSVEAAELLLEHGTDVEQESLGTTALHWAAARGALDLIRFLADSGANLDAVGYKFDPAGQTPLQLATARGRDGAAALLRDLGAS